MVERTIISFDVVLQPWWWSKQCEIGHVVFYDMKEPYLKK